MYWKMTLDDMPPEVIVQIVCYLEPREILQLESLVGGQEGASSTLKVLDSAIKKILNTKCPKLLLKVRNMYSHSPIVNLPFWGFQTDGGVLQHNIPFWIGKAFTKTNKPTVGMQKSTSCTFSGVISQDYHEFCDIVMSLSRVLSKYMGPDNFHDSLDDTSLRLVIMLSFHMNLNDAPEVLREEFMKYKLKLYQYATTYSQFLARNQDYHVVYEDIIRMQQVANLHSVELSRDFHSDIEELTKNMAQTVLVGTGEKPTLASLKGLKLDISRTNLNQDELESWRVDKEWRQSEESKYVIFKPNPSGILFWFDFGEELTCSLAIPFSSRPWTNTVHACILKGSNQTFRQGLTLSYISFRGIIV